MASYEAVRSLLNKGGVARPTLYRVIVPTIKVGNIMVNDQLELLCKSTSIPEVSVQTVTSLGQHAQGVSTQSPSNIVFAKPFTITVISDANYIVYKGMRRWFNSLTTNIGSNPEGGGAAAAQKINYYDNVSATITIVKEENRQRQPFSVLLHKAYPVLIGEIGLDSSAVNQALEFSVSFYYETLQFIG